MRMGHPTNGRIPCSPPYWSHDATESEGGLPPPSSKEGRRQEMYNDYHFAVVQDRGLRELDFAERVAERNRCAPSANRPSLRARMARRLFSWAIKAERTETGRLAGEQLGIDTPLRPAVQRT
jgi:hypothetical protein